MMSRTISVRARSSILALGTRIESLSAHVIVNQGARDWPLSFAG
jgi:hypothetical protein